MCTEESIRWAECSGHPKRGHTVTPAVSESLHSAVGVQCPGVTLVTHTPPCTCYVSMLREGKRDSPGPASQEGHADGLLGGTWRALQTHTFQKLLGLRHALIPSRPGSHGTSHVPNTLARGKGKRKEKAIEWQKSFDLTNHMMERFWLHSGNLVLAGAPLMLPLSPLMFMGPQSWDVPTAQYEWYQNGGSPCPCLRAAIDLLMPAEVPKITQAGRIGQSQFPLPSPKPAACLDLQNHHLQKTKGLCAPVLRLWGAPMAPGIGICLC